MAFDHLKLQVLPEEYKYVLFEDGREFFAFMDTLRTKKAQHPMSLFFSPEECSAIIPSSTPVPSCKEEPGWIGIKVVGDMPFGTVQGLIGKISGALKEANLGVCVVSSYLTDVFFLRSKNKQVAMECLAASGWEIA